MQKQIAKFCHPSWYGAPFTSGSRASKLLLRPHAPASLPTGAQAKCLALGKGTFHSNFALVQYNASPHKAWATMTFLENQDVEVMDRLAKCPDMKLIEHIWDQMAIHIRDMANHSTTQQRLSDAVMAVWDALRPERLR